MRPRVLNLALAVAACAAILSSASTGFAEGDIEWNGYLEEAYGRRIGQNDDVIYHRQTVNTKLTGAFSDFADFRIEANLWRDDPDYEENDEFHSRILQAYVRLGFEKADLRIGRMQIAWGESDGIIISDQVSPFDFTNFVVPSFDAIRMGVDGATLDYYFDDGSDLQLIWIATFQRPDFPDLNSPWSFIDEEELAESGISVAPFERADDTFRNSEFGFRYSRHPLWADWSVGYFHSRDDRPAPRLRGDKLVLTNDFYDLATFNLAAPVGDYLIRIDSAYEAGRFLAMDPTRPESLDRAAQGFVDRHDVWRTMLGLDLKPDVPGWHQADAALRFIHEQVIDPRPGLADRREADFASVRLMAAYRNDSIKPYLFYIHNMRGADSWLQAKIDYVGFDNWRLSIEYDRFHGHGFDPETNNGGFFGGFGGNDLVQATVRRSF